MFTNSEKKSGSYVSLRKLGRRKRGVWVPPEVKEAVGHSGIILFLRSQIPTPLPGVHSRHLCRWGATLMHAPNPARKGSPDCFSFFTLLTSFSTDWPTVRRQRQKWLVIKGLKEMQKHDSPEDRHCPDLSHSSLHWMGMSPSGPSLAEKGRGKQRGFNWEIKTMENLWEVPHDNETTLSMGEETKKAEGSFLPPALRIWLFY